MPHMAPIMWALIMLMNLLLILILTSIIYFNTLTSAPKFISTSKILTKNTWMW
uniref:ATP synthase F0 subunit 8 n=1 Tax=Vulcanolepas fijiensis TaxID=2511776 RepID=A0A649YE52_9CRUS|nr:ATP synthase F0 subunit 8 [Vulcanolepas fijiensis]QGL53228.1 ATP synthase F0 subunit 8 [Vulcanolepas fijiensis]